MLLEEGVFLEDEVLAEREFGKTVLAVELGLVDASLVELPVLL